MLVCNAGITEDTLLLRMSEEQFTSVVDANLTGAFRFAQRASRGMLRKKFGRIVFISSVVGLTGGAGQVELRRAKAGMVGMARSIALELGSRNITANVIAPGFIATDMTAELPEAVREAALKQIPRRPLRRGRRRSRARSRSSPANEAGYINGAVLPVDGGLGMGH